MPVFWFRLARRLPSQGSAFDAPRHGAGVQPPTSPLDQALELDARTAWPTHRIRSFLSMSGGSGQATAQRDGLR
ncbi:hypothetical protein [Melaminivora alkalimesophila]|uniref:Uncharacterized protein n=1 Tax=Melaminivora alkalimesophila TaxID=1165852 RepID=A0A317R9M2_9BURK|nr:hypothetical protein [Melaminivora alkalimesophila]PWW45659.1 hypothetical protein DFR36_106149 [Melaminivora alkalimesophila]